MWRNMAIGVSLIALCGSANSLIPQLSPTPMDRYIESVDSKLKSLKERTTSRHVIDGGRLEVFAVSDNMIPLNGAENLLKLMNIVDEAFSEWNPSLDQPLRVYYLDYKTYRDYATQFNLSFRMIWPNQSQPRPEETLGFFVPLPTGEYTYIIYTWNWYVHLHEMMHVALTAQVSLLTGTNHGAVDPEVNSAWVSPVVQDLVDAATKGDRK